MITKKFINKKHFISTLLHDKIENEVFDIQLKQIQPSLFGITFQDKANNAEASMGILMVHLTIDYKIIYVQMELPGKVFIFKEEVDILPLSVLIIEPDNFYYTMQNLVTISDMSAEFMLV